MNVILWWAVGICAIVLYLLIGLIHGWLLGSYGGTSYWNGESYMHYTDEMVILLLFFWPAFWLYVLVCAPIDLVKKVFKGKSLFYWMDHYTYRNRKRPERKPPYME